MTIARALLMASRTVRLEYIGESAAVGATTLALPAHQAGDLLVVLYVSSGASASIPSDWTTLFNNSGSRTYGAYKIAESDAETVGNWSTIYSYTRRFSFVWRGANDQSPVGAVSYRYSGDYEKLIFPAITADNARSWLVCIGGAATSYLPFTDGGAPTDFPGMTLRFNASQWRRAWDSDGPKGSLGATTIDTNDAVYLAVCLEITPKT